MDLVLWRHAEAEDGTQGADDLERALTSRGEKQARRIASWLDRQLPEGARVLCSPARRCEQTAQALGRKYKVCEALAPGASSDEVLAATGWPHGNSTLLVVGHQPVLGQVAARLMGMAQGECAIRKGALWWFRQREAWSEAFLVCVQSPEML